MVCTSILRTHVFGDPLQPLQGDVATTLERQDQLLLTGRLDSEARTREAVAFAERFDVTEQVFMTGNVHGHAA